MVILIFTLSFFPKSVKKLFCRNFFCAGRNSDKMETFRAGAQTGLPGCGHRGLNITENSKNGRYKGEKS